MKQYLYIITGLPFSGKSTLAKELAKRFGFKITSVDEMIERGGFDVPTMIQEDWNLVYSQAFQTLKELLKSGKSVLFDGGSLLKSERDTLKRIAEKYGVPWKLIYINATKEEIIERSKRNLDTKERDQLEDETMDRAFDMFEEPQKDEYPILFNSKINLEKWIKKNITT